MGFGPNHRSDGNWRKKMKHATTTCLLILSAFILLSCEQSGSTTSPPKVEKAVPVELKPVEKFTPTQDDIVGQWRQVAKNPSHKNTVMKRYMRHTFFNDGKVIIEKEKDTKDGTWEFTNGIFVVSSSFNKSKFIEHYELVDRNKLKKTRFHSIIDGDPLADYDPKEEFIRQGSDLEKSMKIWDLLATVNSKYDFIDPNSLQIGSSYTLSKRTPIMPSYEVSDLNDMVYANSGDSITITDKTTVRSIVWYQVESRVKNGWVNSTALFGQELKQ